MVNKKNELMVRQEIGSKFKKFSICTRIGCLGKPHTEGNNSFDDEVGIGITLYFKLTSYLSILFAIFTVISLPVFYLYEKGRDSD